VPLICFYKSINDNNPWTNYLIELHQHFRCFILYWLSLLTFFMVKEIPEKKAQYIIWLLSFEPGLNLNIICVTRPKPRPFAGQRPGPMQTYSTDYAHICRNLWRWKLQTRMSLHHFYTDTHTHTHTRTRAHTHTHTHTHTHIYKKCIVCSHVTNQMCGRKLGLIPAYHTASYYMHLGHTVKSILNSKLGTVHHSCMRKNMVVSQLSQAVISEASCSLAT
jgi:hypothetical protein